MKPIELIEYAEKNAREILKIDDPHKQYAMMGGYDSCVLRPHKLPDFIKDKMTEQELNQYNINADKFWNQHMIFQAVEWVRNWVKQ